MKKIYVTAITQTHTRALITRKKAETQLPSKNEAFNHLFSIPLCDIKERSFKEKNCNTVLKCMQGEILVPMSMYVGFLNISSR
jgi:hypothetical protein